MLLSRHEVIGHPWAVTPEVADAARRLLDAGPGEHTFAALRAIAELHAVAAAPADASAAGGGTTRRGSTIAVVPILGMLTQRGAVIDSQRTASSAEIADTVRAYAVDPGIHAMVLEVDSPGGSVFGIPEAAAAIRDARASKPVVAAANSIAGSAAYWLASQADEVYVTPSGMVGSIGVYIAHEDQSKATEASGRRVTYVSAGKYKLEGNPHEPLSDEARTYTQTVIDRIYDSFVKDVARGRGVGVEAVREGFGQGRMVLARSAVEQGMANTVGTLDDAIRRAGALATERRRAASSVAEGQAMRARRGR